MRSVLFCHSLLSDWNHGNAHFLRGIVTELAARGADVVAHEPADAWSLENLLADAGPEPLGRLAGTYPQLKVERYRPEELLGDDLEPLERRVDGADLVLVHEWNDPRLVARLGELRRRGGSFLLLFHDTHHRAATAPEEMAAYDLSGYDGVLAFGEVVRRLYLERGWAERAWTWHEAADTRVFRPPGETDDAPAGDLVWIGNWGDDERTAELEQFLLGPIERLGLAARVHGVRYPEAARRALAAAGIDYRGWLPNFEVPAVFARFRATVHVPRRPYVEALPGIPTIRPFEALACGIPLVSAPWNDAEGLFRPGTDFLVARDGAEMERHLATLLAEPERARELAERGLETIRARHTCRHRVDELLAVVAELRGGEAPLATAGRPAGGAAGAGEVSA